MPQNKKASSSPAVSTSAAAAAAVDATTINGHNNANQDAAPVWESSAEVILDILRSINQAQALQANKQRLEEIGGVTELYRLLQTDLDRGIDLDTIETRRQAFGMNRIPTAPRKSFWQLFTDTFEDATLQILMAAAAVSLVIGVYDDPATGYVEGCAILAACLVVSAVTAANDYQKESQFRELSAANDDIDVVVFRQGTHWQIPVSEIVVGDIVELDTGDPIPCDGVLLNADDGQGLQVDESALTGEPIDVDKDLHNDPFLLSGCTVEAGSGKFLAIAVGKESQWGIIQSHLEKEQDQTPLQEKLDDMAALIGYVGMTAAAATFCAMMFIKIVIQPEYLAEISIFSYALEAFIIGVTIVVVAVPEGLPLAVTISLAFSTKKMLADQNLIRHLAACETMGNATNICSDKTGTLTENRMTVVKGVFADTRCDDTIHRVPILVSQNALEIILDCIACCSTAKVVHAAPTTTTTSEDTTMTTPTNRPPHVIGNKTEAALLLLAQSGWSHQDDTEKRRARANFGKEGGSRLFPFSSTRKRMSVLVNKGSSSSSTASFRMTTRSSAQKKESWTLYHKGAAEVILANCTRYLDIDGSEKPMNDRKRQEYETLIRQFANEALRCVALAHRHDVERVVDPLTVTMEDCEKKLEKDMCLDAIAGIMDPLRPDVVEAVAACQKAGIFVRMVTGDNLDTARAIAKAAGILTEGGISMCGADFRKLTPAQLDEILPRLQVLARSSPEDKHTLVQRLNGALMPETEEEWLEAHPGKNYMKHRDLLLPGYKEEWGKSRHNVGEVVGVTGDGTNDGPALKAADVGMSMGLSGTDVAKKASDIIIMDDRFSSIVKAVLWGRSVFDNIRKFLQFQLTVNVVALTITFLSAVAGYQPPLNAVMMLWVNLIMDTMGALALGTEPPRKELLDRSPYRRDASLISRPMWRNILCQATYQLIVLVFLLNKGPRLFNCEDGSNHHFTIIFNAFVFCQVFNEFNAREIGDRFDPIRSMEQSPMFISVILFTVVAQFLIVEYGGHFTQTYPLDWEEWKFTVMLGAGSIPVGFMMRMIPVQEDPATFAGIERKGGKPKGASFFMALLIALIPILGAIVYQLYFEIEEFIQPHEETETL
jgi:calcium-translocating P-type ATPase